MHVVLLSLVLLSLVPLVGTTGLFSADEGAALAQADQLSSGRGWTEGHPFPAADPGLAAFPLAISDRRGDRFAPFSKHAVYPVILAGLDRLGGVGATVAFSLVGAVGAALVAALLAERLRPGSGKVALWLAGLATPLLFDGYLLIAHAPGAAFMGGAVLATVVAFERADRTNRYLAAAAASTVAATLLRNEAFLYAVALGAVAMLVAWRAGRRRLAVAVLLIPLAAAIAHVADGRLASTVLGGPATSQTGSGNAGGGGLPGKVFAFVITWLLPSYRLDLGAILVLLAGVATVAAALVVRRRPSDGSGALLLATVAVAAILMRLLLEPRAVPGLLMAAPILAFGLLLAPRPLGKQVSQVALLSTAGYAALVLATQYRTGGSGEWGGRYFALGLPVAAAFAATGVQSLPARIGPRVARRLSALLAVLAFAFAALALGTLRHSHEQAEDLRDRVSRVAHAAPAGDGGTPVVVTTSDAGARFCWPLLDGERWLTIDDKDLGTYAARLRALGIDRFTLVVSSSDAFPAVPQGYEVEPANSPDGWRIATIGL